MICVTILELTTYKNVSLSKRKEPLNSLLVTFNVRYVQHLRFFTACRPTLPRGSLLQSKHEHTHRCQPSRNRAGNPIVLLISRIPAFLRERPAFLAIFRSNKNRNNFSCMETFCSKKLCENVNDSVAYSTIRLLRLSTSAAMGIHLVRVPQDVDVVNVR